MEPYTNYTMTAEDYYEDKIAEEQDELTEQLTELSFISVFCIEYFCHGHIDYGPFLSHFSLKIAIVLKISRQK